MVPAVYTNQNEALIAWKYESSIPGCVGFAIYKKILGEADTLAEPLQNRVGFADEAYTLGEERPSTAWPIQRFVWNDFTVKTGDQVQYMVVPMLLENGDLVKDVSNTSGWSAVATVDTGTTYKAYFNRGVVASQFFSRKNTNVSGEISKANDQANAPAAKGATSPNSVFKQVITGGPGKLRDYFGGCLSTALFKILDDAIADPGVTVFAALYELKLDDLTDRLLKMGQRANLILANGTGKEPSVPDGFEPNKDLGFDDKTLSEDENIIARSKLCGKIKLYHRMVNTGVHFAHNKFMVYCKNGVAQKVLTGTTNWTPDGVFAQVNNSIVIEDATLAEAYLKEWNMIKDAGNGYPDSLYKDNSAPRVSSASLKAWCNPLVGLLDLKDVEGMLNNAKKGFMFLMFNPGPKDTVFNTILGLIQKRPELYIRGVMNQDPGGSVKNGAPLVFFDQKNEKATNWDILLPKTIKDPFSFWYSDVSDGLVTIHSKSIVIDPFGDDPIVITGSNNLGPKASGKNDDNFVVVRDRKLASEYAANIFSVYSHYHWRYSLANNASNGFKGLTKDPDWMGSYMNGEYKKQMSFLLY